MELSGKKYLWKRLPQGGKFEIAKKKSVEKFTYAKTNRRWKREKITLLSASQFQFFEGGGKILVPT